LSNLTIKKLGYIGLSGTAIVSDPCYDREVRCMEKDIPTLPGRYCAYIVISDEGDWGNRVASLIAVHEDFRDADDLYQPWETLSDEIGVDSGQCGIFDDSAYPQHKTDPGFGSFYDEVGELTMNEDQGGILFNERGAVSSTGYGDGGYTLTGVEHNRRYVALAIDYGLIKQPKILGLLAEQAGRELVEDEDEKLFVDEFYNYIMEKFNLDGAASRLVNNILRYIEYQGMVDAEDNYRHLHMLLDGAFGLSENEMKRCDFRQ
jgi:hypothetical protein